MPPFFIFRFFINLVNPVAHAIGLTKLIKSGDGRLGAALNFVFPDVFDSRCFEHNFNIDISMSSYGFNAIFRAI